MNRMVENNKNELERILYLQDTYQKQIEVIGQQMILVNNRIKSIESIIEGISDLKENKEKEILLPLGDDVFVKSALKSDMLIVNSGAGIFLERDFDETKKILTEKIMKLSKMLENMQKTSSELENMLVKLNSDAEKIINQQQ